MFGHRVKAIVLTGLIVLSTVLSLFLSPQKAYAAGTLLDTARGWSVLKATIDYSTNLKANPTKAEVDTCRIFRDSHAIGQHVSISDGMWNVSTPPADTISSGLNAVGIAGCSDLMLTLGYTLNGDTYNRGGSRGVNDGLDRSDVVAKLKAKGVESNLIGSDINNDSPSDTITYIILYQILTKTCGWQFRNAYVEGGGANDDEKKRNEEAKKNSYYGDTQGQHSHTYAVENNKAGDNTYYVDGGRQDDIYLGPGTSGINMNTSTQLDCADNNEDTVGGRLATRHQYADTYARYVAAHPDAQTGFDRDAPPSSDANGGTSTCGIKTAIGWILCPVTQFLAVMLDKMYEFISSKFLVVPSALFDINNGTYKSWKIFRDYANVAFIIAFLIIVYSQVTSVGISNYGIKKLLPKLIIAAVLVNISYYICQGLVELTNLLGYGIKSMFDGVSSSIQTPGGGSGDTGEGGTVAGIITTALAGTAVVVIAVALGLIIPAIVAVGITFIILLIRQALIVILIVLSPLAFVAWLLPNTESLFKKWWGMLVNTLMVFPLIAFLFGGAKLASVVLASTDDSNITQLLAVGVATVPLFMVLPLLNKAIKELPVLGKKMQNMGDKATGRIGGKARKRSGEMGQGIKKSVGRRASLVRSQLSGRQDIIGSLARRKSRRDFRHKSMETDTARNQEASLLADIQRNPGNYSERQRADAAATLSKRRSEEVSAQARNMKAEATTAQGAPAGSPISSYSSRTGSIGHLQDRFHRAVESGDADAARAAMMALKENGEGGVEAIQETIAEHERNNTFNSEASRNDLREFINESHSDLKSSDARITSWAGENSTNATARLDSISHNSFNGLSDEQIASQTSAALTDATSRSTATTGPLDNATRTRIRAAVQAGTVKTKQSKLQYF